MTGPAVCLLPAAPVGGPADVDAIADAVRAAGGHVTPPESATAMVWTEWSDADALRSVIHAHPGLEWVQLVTAGVDSLAPALDRARTWTSAKGAYGAPIAEYALAAVLAGLRSFPAYATARRWEARPARTLRGARVTLVGGGGISQALIPLLHACGSRVTVVRRHAEPLDGADAVVTLDALPTTARTTDVLVLALALTPETEGVVDEGLLRALPAHCLIVNVARGRHIDTDALVDALAGNRLAGAVLDVTDPEPLPAGHPLWQIESCLVTPHASCPSQLARPLLLERVRENVRRFGAGEPLLGRVDPTLAY